MSSEGAQTRKLVERELTSRRGEEIRGRYRRHLEAVQAKPWRLAGGHVSVWLLVWCYWCRLTHAAIADVVCQCGGRGSCQVVQ